MSMRAMGPEFRRLNDREMGLLQRLLEAEFVGRDELRTQLQSVVGKQIEEDGTLSLRCASGSPSPAKQTLAVEGECKDADGMAISIMLHVDKDGFMNMLEIYRYDISQIIRPPAANELILLAPKHPGERPNGHDNTPAG
jgi:Domain of unknown function (DUF6984)